MPPSMHNKLAASIPPPIDAVINELRRVCNIIGIPHSHNRAPPTQNRNFPWDTVRCNKMEFISHALPKTPLTTSSARLLILFTPLWERIILNYGRTFLPLLLSSHLDPLHYCMAPPRQPISLWRSIVQQLAGSHPHIEQSALPLKMALDISYLLSGNIPIAHTNAGGYGLPVGN
ncbi:hypothetical protein TCDM_09830 [Trypanosoma cruzi Dm28c]|uniref:Uncharacterized protein n=1 Tax=Trypanosoma cruzi Dm28c TaxID=1416333 RepID=V5AP35_TRYCR|nr:hypothetical protein TCDM_09830 [Trypanosoma cruzi Dm28c]